MNRSDQCMRRYDFNHLQTHSVIYVYCSAFAINAVYVGKQFKHGMVPNSEHESNTTCTLGEVIYFTIHVHVPVLYLYPPIKKVALNTIL